MKKLVLHLADIVIVNEYFYLNNAGILVEGNKIVKVAPKDDFGDIGNASTEIIEHKNSCPGVGCFWLRQRGISHAH